MDSNKDIKIFVVNSESYKSLLKDIGYDVKDEISQCSYLLIRDDDKEFDVNLYRSQIKYALDNDITLVFSSKGIPCFVNQFTDGAYFSKVFLDDCEYITTHWNVLPPPSISSDEKSPSRFSIFPTNKEPKEFIDDNGNNFIYHNNRDRCCFVRWKGLFY